MINVFKSIPNNNKALKKSGSYSRRPLNLSLSAIFDRAILLRFNSTTRPYYPFSPTRGKRKTSPSLLF